MGQNMLGRMLILSSIFFWSDENLVLKRFFSSNANSNLKKDKLPKHFWVNKYHLILVLLLLRTSGSNLILILKTLWFPKGLRSENIFESLFKRIWVKKSGLKKIANTIFFQKVFQVNTSWVPKQKFRRSCLIS